MAGEIQFTDVSGMLNYVLLLSTTGEFYNATLAAFEPFTPPNFPDYALPATELEFTGIYLADMPAGLAPNFYNVVAKRQVAAAPATSDPIIAAGSVGWSGVAVPPPAIFPEVAEPLVAPEFGTATFGDWFSWLAALAKNPQTQTIALQTLLTNAGTAAIASRMVADDGQIFSADKWG